MFTDDKRVSAAYKNGEGIGVVTFAATPILPLHPSPAGVGGSFRHAAGRLAGLQPPP